MDGYRGTKKLYFVSRIVQQPHTDSRNHPRNPPAVPVVPLPSPYPHVSISLHARTQHKPLRR
jgi:hypothetical protein